MGVSFSNIGENKKCLLVTSERKIKFLWLSTQYVIVRYF